MNMASKKENAYHQLDDMFQNYRSSPKLNPIDARDLKDKISTLNSPEKFTQIVSRTNKNGENILHVAARNGGTPIIKLVLKSMDKDQRWNFVSPKKAIATGFFAQLRMRFGWSGETKCNTPLHFAVEWWIKRDRTAVDALLINSGLTDTEVVLLLNSTDERNRTPADIATGSYVDKDKSKRIKRALDDMEKAALTKAIGQQDNCVNLKANLETEINARQAEKNAHEAKIKDLEQEKITLAAGRDDDEARINKLRIKIKTMEAERITLEAKMEDQRNALKCLEAENHTLKSILVSHGSSKEVTHDRLMKIPGHESELTKGCMVNHMQKNFIGRYPPPFTSNNNWATQSSKMINTLNSPTQASDEWQ